MPARIIEYGDCRVKTVERHYALRVTENTISACSIGYVYHEIQTYYCAITR